jgi:fumarate hydratase class I
MIPNCAATRHTHFVLDGSGPALQTPPSLEDWPEITWEVGADVRRVNLDTVTAEDVAPGSPAIRCCCPERCSRVGMPPTRRCRS